MHDDSSSISTAKHMYQNVQHNSAMRKGNALFQSFSSNQSDAPLRDRRQRGDASLRSSINTLDSNVMTPQANISTHHGVSAMGHRLIHVHAPEEEYGLEVSRDDIKQLMMGQDDRIVGDQNFDTQSVGHYSGSGSRYAESKSLSGSTMIYSDYSTSTKKLNPRCQVTLALLGIAFLLGTCLMFTFVSLSNKTYDDWIEPDRNAYLNEGIDWAPGPDAPPPFESANVDPLIEKNIANWALGTLRVSSEATIDGYGSVSMSQLVLARDVPLFFGMEYTGAAMMDMLLGNCLNMIQASNSDLTELTNQNDQISMIYSNGRKYVNVDTTTRFGIDRAYSMKLVDSGIADVIYSPLLHDVSSLFSPKHQARLFIIMRHPVEAQFARFRYLRSTSEKNMPERHDELAKMSYEEFANSEFVDDNWMTRALVHKMYGEVLVSQDMETAKELLRRKAIIGLYDDPLVSFKKFARYFNWDQLRSRGYFTENTNKCFKNAIEVAQSKDLVLGTLNLKDEDAIEGSGAWNAILKRNQFDYELYMYGRHLYKYQIGLS